MVVKILKWLWILLMCVSFSFFCRPEGYIATAYFVYLLTFPLGFVVMFLLGGVGFLMEEFGLFSDSIFDSIAGTLMVGILGGLTIFVVGYFQWFVALPKLLKRFLLKTEEWDENKKRWRKIKFLWIFLAVLVYVISVVMGKYEINLFMVVLTFPLGLLWFVLYFLIYILFENLLSVPNIPAEIFSLLRCTGEWIAFFIVGYLQWFIALPYVRKQYLKR